MPLSLPARSPSSAQAEGHLLWDVQTHTLGLKARHTYTHTHPHTHGCKIYCFPIYAKFLAASTLCPNANVLRLPQLNMPLYVCVCVCVCCCCCCCCICCRICCLIVCQSLGKFQLCCSHKQTNSQTVEQSPSFSVLATRVLCVEC